MLQRMREEDWLNVAQHQKEHVSKKRLLRHEHVSDFKIGQLSFLGTAPYGRYIDLINPNMHLSKVVSKLNSIAEPILVPESNEVLDPKIMADDLIRYCELNRKEPVYLYKDDTNNSIISAVSGRHSRVYDTDVYEVMNEFFKDIPHQYQFESDMYRSRITVSLPELAIKLGGDNSMNFRFSIGNSEFGYGSCYCDAGSYEQWCTNGARAWVSKFKWQQIHVSSPESILRNLADALLDQMSKADQYMTILENANEVSERYIKENVNVINFLRKDKFGFLKREAESIYRRIRNNTRYQRMNAFDVGRAIAEEARDTNDMERKLWMENLAGKVMVAQVITK